MTDFLMGKTIQEVLDEHKEKELAKHEQLRAMAEYIADLEALVVKKNEQFSAISVESVSERCARTHLQCCHTCEKLECIDNESPAKKRIAELEKYIQGLEAIAYPAAMGSPKP